MACFVRMSPVMYVIFVYAVYMLLVFPITELITFLVRTYTDVPPADQYLIARWIYLAFLVSFMPCYLFAFYLSWRKNRAKPLFVPKWKTSDNLEEDDFMCTICYDLLVEPQTLRCQHSFCKKCISQSLRLTRKCPSCQQWVYWCSTNEQLKKKIKRWVKEQDRAEEYAEVVELKSGMKIEKNGFFAGICSYMTPFFELPEPRVVRMRPMRRLQAGRVIVEPVPEPLVMHVRNEAREPAPQLHIATSSGQPTVNMN